MLPGHRWALRPFSDACQLAPPGKIVRHTGDSLASNTESALTIAATKEYVEGQRIILGIKRLQITINRRVLHSVFARNVVGASLCRRHP